MEATQWGLIQRKSLGLVIIIIALGILSGCGNNNKVNNPTVNGQACENKAKARSFLVKWKSEIPSEFIGNKIDASGLVTRFEDIDQSLVEKEVLQKYSGRYEIAEHEFVLTPDTTFRPVATNCSGVNTAWGPADINAAEAWNILGSKGDGVVVAVIDTGVDLQHPLLKDRIWSNPAECPPNGRDDDGNGLIDDCHGWNFLENTGTIIDDAGHGTHIAGVIAGQAGMGQFTGIAPNAQIMPLRFLNSQGGAVTGAIAALHYATSKGAQVINASWGGDECSDVLKSEIAATTAAGTVFVNAAGNSGNDISVIKKAEYPAAYQIPGKITIGSYNASQFLSSFSNYGTLVDLAAPGECILSTYISSGAEAGVMAILSGTSMATPFVAGVAALLKGARPNLSVNEIANIINSTVKVGSHFGVRTQGKVDAAAAARAVMSH